MTRTEEAPLYNKLPENEKQYALFTAVVLWGSVGGRRLLYGVLQDVSHTAEGEGEWSQFAEVRAIQLALGIAERHKGPVLYLCSDTWMVANALWGWLQWQQSNWQCRGKPIWAAALWQDVENLSVNICRVDAHVPKSWAAVKKTASRWIRPLRLKCLRWTRTSNVQVSYLQLSGPVTPRAIKAEMEHTDGLVIGGWT